MRQVFSQLLLDVQYTFEQYPHEPLAGSLAVARLFFWHLILKRVRYEWLGTYQGMRFLFNAFEDGSANAYITPHYEPALQILLRTVLQKNSVFYDVGANVGLTSLLALKYGARVYAFEPSPESRRHLKINILLNAFERRCQIVKEPLAEKEKTVAFLLNDLGHAAANGIASSSQPGTVKMRATTLDTFVSTLKLDRIDLLKIDVEGGELSVLRGADTLLGSKKVSLIFWESNTVAAQTERDTTRQLLSKYGYTHLGFSTDQMRFVAYSNQDDCLSVTPLGLQILKKHHLIS